MTKYKSILIMVPSHIMFRYYIIYWSIFYIDVKKSRLKIGTQSADFVFGGYEGAAASARP